jgi:hypothetical protein
LPVIADISDDYRDEVVFLGVAGRGSLEDTAARADELFGERITWGLDDSIWDLYGVPYQPVTVLITGDDHVVDTWAGVLEEDEIRSKLDDLVGQT